MTKFFIETLTKDRLGDFIFDKKSRRIISTLSKAKQEKLEIKNTSTTKTRIHICRHEDGKPCEVIE